MIHFFDFTYKDETSLLLILGFEDKIEKDYLEDWKETVIEKVQENDDIVKITEYVTSYC